MAHSKEEFLQEREYQEQEKQEREIIQKHYGLEQVNGIEKDKKTNTKKQKK